MCLLALDINKAYDQVYYYAMDIVLFHVDITANPFYWLYTLACDSGPV